MDKAHCVTQKKVKPIGETNAAKDWVKSRKKLRRSEHSFLGEAVEQCGFSCIRVTHKRDYRNRAFFSAFSLNSSSFLKIQYFFFVGIAGALSLGLADTFFYKAAEINGLVLTSTFTANTPMVQQILSIFILKEKFRKRFIVAVGLIIIGNYIIIFL